MVSNPKSNLPWAPGYVLENVQQIDIMDLVRIPLRYWRSILAITAIFTVLSLLYVYRLENYYVATAQILVDPEGSRYVEGDLSNGQKATDAHALNQQYILTSVKVLSQVVQQEDLANDPEFGATRPYDSRKDVRAQRALEVLQKVVVATLTKSSFVVNLSVTAGDPEKAARIANRIADTYIQTRIQMNTVVVRQATSDLTAQLATLEQKVIEGDKAIQSYRTTHNLIDIDGRPTVERQITEVTTEISKISANLAENDAIASEILRAQSEKDYFRSMLDNYLTPTIVTLRSRYHEALQRQSILEASLGSKHPAIANAIAAVQAARGMLDQQLNNLNLSLTRNAERLKKQRDLLQRNLNVLQDSLNRNDTSMVALRELERQLASDRLVYESFLLRTRQLTGQEKTISENPQIISAALAPLGKAGPRRSLIVACATLLGIMIGAGLSIARDRYASSPQLETQSRPVDENFPSNGGTYQYWANELMVEAGQKQNYCVLSYSSVDVGAAHHAVLRIAQAVAAHGKKTLLVDAATNAALTREMQLQSLPGLANVQSSSSINCKFYQFPGLPTLKIMAGGFKSSLLSFQSAAQSETLADLLHKAGIVFDLIIIDGGRVPHRPSSQNLEDWADKIVVLYAQNSASHPVEDLSFIQTHQPVRKIFIPEAEAA